MNKITSVDSVLSDKHVVIACDLFLSLRLYKLPEWLRKDLKVAFPNIKVVPINIPNEPIVHKTATVYWGNRITPEIIQSMPELKWIHFGSVGTNLNQTSEIIEREILVTSSKGTTISSMVVTALAFMTALARGLHRSEMLRRRGTMNRENFDLYFDQIHEFSGERCLIVGFGDVGKKLAKVCNALDMKVTAISRSTFDKEIVEEFFFLEELSTAVAKADYVVNLLPLTEKTKEVFTKDVFLSMKPSVFFVNIGRGETVDENALIMALKEGLITGAGLDVFAEEPLSSKSLLWKMDNVLLSPHVAGLSKGYWDRQAELFTYNLGCYLNGDIKKMRNIVDIN